MERIEIGKTKISISGYICDVSIERNEEGNLEVIIPDDQDLFIHGTTISGYGDEIVISEYVPTFYSDKPKN